MKEPRGGGIAALLGGLGGFILGCVLLVTFGLPFAFAMSIPCVDREGARVACGGISPMAVMLMTLLAVVTLTWLGAWLGRAIGRSSWD